jgi:FdhE protein
MTSFARTSSLDDVVARHPESHGWLSLYRVVHAALAQPGWAEAVPPQPAAGAGEPLMAGAVLTVDTRAVRRLVDAVLDRAQASIGEPGVAPFGAEASLALVEAAINEDSVTVSALAAERSVGPALLAEAAALAAMPLLQACRAAWGARVQPDWMAAACPVCGAWATLCEARGVERTMRLRCGRCGADWTGQPVRCPFCGNIEHATLGALVSERTGDTRKVETCSACLGYVKTVTTLQACPPAEVRLLDLDTVDLDIAALERGYARPSRPAHHLGLRVVARQRGRLATLFGR